MAGKNTAVFGIYPDYAAVENGVDALKAAEFRNTDISVLFPENVGTKDFAHEKGTKAPEGASASAGTGALQWDARNSAGRDVTTGGYFAVVSSPGQKSVVKKFAIIR